ncbi:putative ribonuclease H-like domain-containing protein [Tanacetum coccineum]
MNNDQRSTVTMGDKGGGKSGQRAQGEWCQSNAQKGGGCSPQSSEDAIANDAGKKTNEELANEGERNGQEKEGRASNKEDDQNVQDFNPAFDNLLVQQKKGYANGTNRDSTVSISVSAVGQSFTNANDLPTGPLMPDLEDTDIFSGAYDDEDVGAEADLNNLETTMNVSPILTTRIHKDHPKDQIIRDINLATQTRRMTKISEERAMMDVKSTFLYGTIEEEVYVCQPPGFEDPQFPDKVYKVEKALYGLHQAPRAWYETLSTYLLENGFRRGTIDKTLFIKKDKGDILLVQVYVDDIIFGSTKKSLCVEFEQMMHKRFQMSSMGELTFFLGLQVKQKDDGIFISQDKYVADILKKFDFVTMKTASTPIETNKALLKDEEAEDVDVHLYRSMIGSLMYLTASRPDIMFVVCACARDLPFDLEAFTDNDYAGASLDRKSTTGVAANSTTEAEYVAAANCCGQVLWMQIQMLDYGFNFMNTKIYIDKESTICIVKNPVFHSKTKHIEIRHHFIRDSYEKRLIQVLKIHTDHNVADLLTKAFNVNETVYKEWEDRMERAATTASSLEAEQDSSNINRTQSMATLNESFPLGIDSSSGPRVNTLRSREDNMKLKELMELCTKLSERILDIKTDRVNWHSLTAVRHKLMLPGITSYCWFWTSAKAKTVNGERQIQALVDKKKVIITETSIRSDLNLDDAEGTDCLPTATIFVEMERMGAKTTSWNEFSSTMASSIICLATNQKFNFSKYIFDNMVKNLEGGVKFLMYLRFMQVFLDKQVEGMSKHKGIYVIPSHTKKVFANMKRPGKGFSGKVTPLFETMMVQATEDMGEDSAAPTDSHSTPIHTQPSLSKPQNKNSKRNRGRAVTTKSNQALEIESLKRRVKSLEKRRKSRTSRLKRLRKVGLASRVESSNDVSLGAQEDASKQGRKITDLDADAEVTLVDETQEINDDNLMFDTGVLEEQEIEFEKVVKEPVVSVATTTKSIPVSVADPVTTAGEIKTLKPKPVTTTATIVTSVRPRAKGIVFHDQEEQVPASTKTFSSSQSQLPQVKDKGKGKMVEPEVPLKKKDQIALDEELALRLHAEEQAELEKERVT